MASRNPVHRRLHLAAVRGGSAARLRVVTGVNLSNSSVRIFDDVGGCHQIGAAQAHLMSGGEAEEFAGRVLAEIIGLNPELSGEGDATGAVVRILRIIDQLEPFHHRVAVVVSRPAVKDKLEGVQHSHAPLSGGVELAAHEGLKLLNGLDRVVLGSADGLAEGSNGGCWVSTATHTAQGGHARIIPSVNDVVGY